MSKSPNIELIIKAIIPLNNLYRDSNVSIQKKLEALWEMGDQLARLGVKAPHSLGWIIQKETKDLIKRPTIFRSYKIRSIWHSKEDLLKDLGSLRGLSSLTELIPLIDPAQRVRSMLSVEQINDLYYHACSDSPQKFKEYLANIKKTFSYGRLGKSLDKTKHLDRLRFISSEFSILLKYLLVILNNEDPSDRKQFRTKVSTEELKGFSNMCIALTTKDNYRLFKRLGPPVSTSQNIQFKKLYCYFNEILNNKSDVKRARLRRVIPAEALAQMSDMISSLDNEVAVRDFKERQNLTIKL